MDPNLRRLFKNAAWFGFFLLVLFIVVWKLSLEEDGSLCSKSRFPGSCYQVEEEVCAREWVVFANECKHQIDKLNLPPARLTGPIMDRCQKSKYDRVFHYLRKQSPNCDRELEELETWRKSNPGF